MAIQTEPVVTQFKAEIDQGSFNKAIQSIKDIQKQAKIDVEIAVGNVDKQIQSITKQIREGGQKGKISFDFDETLLRASLADGLKNVKMFARDTKVELDKNKFIDLNINIAKAESQLATFRQELKTATGQRRAELILDTKNAQSSLTEASRRLQNFKNIGDEATSRLQAKFNALGSGIRSSIGNALTSIGIVGGIAGIVGLGKAVFGLVADYQKYNAVLKNSLGSQAEATASLNLIKDVASKTPFELNSLTESYIKLVNRGFKPTREEIISLGDLASSQGKQFDQLTEALLDAQTGEFERLKEFGVKAKVSGDQVAFTFKGVTTTVSKTDDAIRAYVLSLGNLQGISGSMAEQSKTLGGQFSNLLDSLTQLGTQIGVALLPVFQGLVSGISSLISFLSSIGTQLPIITTLFAGLGASLLILNFGGIVAGVTGFLGTLPLLISGITALGLSVGLATGGLSLLVGGIVALGTAFATNAFGLQDFVNGLFGIEAGVNVTSTTLTGLNTKLDEVSQKMKALQEDFKAGKISLEEYQTASADLESQKASLTAEIDKETQKLQENQAVLGNTTERLKENIAELERLEAQKNLNNQLYEDGMITEEAAIATNESLSKKIAELTKENRDLQLSQQDVQDIINSFSAARTIDELNKQVAKAKDVVKANINAARSFIALQELRGEEVDTKALQKFLATQQEIAKTIDQQAKVQKEVIQSGKLPSIDSGTDTQKKKTGSGKQKLSAEDQAKKDKAEAEKAEKEILDNKIKAVNDAAEAEILALGRTEKAKQENADKILQIDKKRNEDIAKLQGKQDDLIVKSAQAIKDANDKALKSFGDSAGGILDKFDTAIANTKTKLQEIDDKIKDATTSLGDIDKEIADRAVELTKSIAETQVSITTEQDPQKQLDLQKELAAQQAELQLAQSKVSADLIAQEQKQSELSDTELLLQKKDELNQQLVDLQTQKDQENAILKTALDQQLIAEQAFTSALGLEIGRRNAFLDAYIKKLSESSLASRLGTLSETQTAAGRLQSAVNNTTITNNISDPTSVQSVINALTQLIV